MGLPPFGTMSHISVFFFLKASLSQKKLLGPHPSPKNSPIGPQKPQNDPKKAKIKKVRKQKIYFSSYINHKTARYGPKRLKMTRINTKSKSLRQKSNKMKVISLYEETSKTYHKL